MYAHFVTGGSRHEAAWKAYGPCPTRQLALTYLLAGDPARVDELLIRDILFFEADKDRDPHVYIAPGVPEQVRFVHPCRFGPVRSVSADGRQPAVTRNDVQVPPGTRQFTVSYA